MSWWSLWHLASSRRILGTALEDRRITTPKNATRGKASCPVLALVSRFDKVVPAFPRSGLRQGIGFGDSLSHYGVVAWESAPDWSYPGSVDT